MRHIPTILTLILTLCNPLLSKTLRAEVPFRIQVVDEVTERGVPLVELQTVNNIRFYTDSQGVVAIDEPGLSGLEVFFHVKSHGYEYPTDGFGYRGTKLKIESGGNARLKIKRINIAERLYRLTGAAIYRDSVLTKTPVPIKAPLMNGQVFGSDSTVSAIYRNKLYWFWGDTNRPQYPLGNFQVSGATSLLPGNGGLDPAVGVDLDFFVGENGFARAMTKMPGNAATWISGLTVIPDKQTGRERMFAGYMRVKPGFNIDHYGLSEFDDETNSFRSIADFGRDPYVTPMGHPIRLSDGGTEYVYFGTTIPFIRVPARPESLSRLDDYEAYTCLRAGSRRDKPEIDRASDGTVIYDWKRNTSSVDHREQQKLTDSSGSKPKLLKPHEGLFQLRDRDTGKQIVSHYGSCQWNEYRKRFVLIFVQSEGDHSKLGEVWYAEGDSPLGPWVYAVKIITHDRYTFYSPKQHPEFAQQGARFIYIDGTYSHDFSGNPDQTPRYDYNQIMYRLDLGDPRLVAPVAIYRQQELPNIPFAPRLSTKAETSIAAPDRSKIEFFACDRPADSLIAVYAERAHDGHVALKADASPGDRQVLFYALPADSTVHSTATASLNEFLSEDGRRKYSIDSAADEPSFRRVEKPLCRVWKNPYSTR